MIFTVLDRLAVPSYVAMTVLAVLSLSETTLHSMALYGKMRMNIPRSWINRFEVPKQLFTHFYIVGIVSLGLVWWGYQQEGNEIDVVFFILLLSHLIRRLYECLYVHRWRSKSRMHIAGYLVGVLHYLFLPFVFYSYKTIDLKQPRIILLLLFNFWAQYQQYRHHIILALIRENEEDSTVYQLPVVGWFQYVACPHYLAEIFIYLSFALWQVDRIAPWIVFLWVVTNLSISARANLQWYRTRVTKCPVQYCALIPNLF